MNLIIIGNGFDLCHKLKTSYNDFRNYVLNDCRTKQLLKNDYKLILEYVLSIYLDNWSDFENSLGLINFDKILNDLMTNDNVIIEPLIKYNCSCFLVNAFVHMKELFNEWLKTINTNCVKKEYFSDLFAEENVIISFNYTDTIEKNYGVKNVIHLHGKVGDEIVLGHNALFVYPSADSSFLADYNIEKIHNFLKKNTEKSENTLKEILSVYSEKIEKIYIFGHSIGVDLVYYYIIRNYIKNPVVFINDYKNDFYDKKIMLSNLGFKIFNKVKI